MGVALFAPDVGDEVLLRALGEVVGRREHEVALRGRLRCARDEPEVRSGQVRISVRIRGLGDEEAVRALLPLDFMQGPQPLEVGRPELGFEGRGGRREPPGRFVVFVRRASGRLPPLQLADGPAGVS